MHYSHHTDTHSTELRAVSRKAFGARWDLSLSFVDKLLAEGIIPQIRLSRKVLRIPLEEADAALLRFQTGGQK